MVVIDTRKAITDSIDLPGWTVDLQRSVRLTCPTGQDIGPQQEISNV